MDPGTHAVSFEFALAQVYRHLRVCHPGSNPWSVLDHMMDTADQAEFRKTQRLLTWPSQQETAVATRMTVATVEKARAKLRKMGIIRPIGGIGKRRGGRDNIAIFEIEWRRPVPVQFWRINADIPLARSLERDDRRSIEGTRHATTEALAEQRNTRRGRGETVLISTWPTAEPLPTGARRA